MRRLILQIVFGLTLGALLAGCARARHVAVVADASVAAAVFAVDDAEYAACQAHVLTVPQCETLNVPILKALRDVRAVTVAIQNTPTTGPAPTSLVALLTDLGIVQRILADLGQSPDLAPLVAKALEAQTKAGALIASFTGGQ